MDSVSMELQRGVVITREAHNALCDLKALVDLATKKIHTAELEVLAATISPTLAEDPEPNLMAVSEMLHSPRFKTVLRNALAKSETAVAWHLPKRKAAHPY